MDFFHKGGGGSKAIQKFWDTFVHQPIWNFGQKKGGGVDQIQKFLDTFYPGKRKKSIIKLHFFYGLLPKETNRRVYTETGFFFCDHW